MNSFFRLRLWLIWAGVVGYFAILERRQSSLNHWSLNLTDRMQGWAKPDLNEEPVPDTWGVAS